MKENWKIFCLFTCLFIHVSFAVIAADNGPALLEHSVKAPLAPKSLLLDIANCEGRFIGVGERGHILYSDDGNNWQQADVPIQSLLTAVYCHDENTAWAVGHDASILRSTDGGYTWELVSQDLAEERPFLDIWFENSRYGIAIGAYGFFSVTEDGGLTWDIQEFNVVEEVNAEQSEVNLDAGSVDFTESYDLHLNSISLSPQNWLYIAAEAGRIYRSKDSGKTWAELPSPYIGSFFGILAVDNDTLLVFGLRGHLYRSDDSGFNWTQKNTNTNELLTDGIQLSSGVIVVSGLGGTLLISHDRGNTFNRMEIKSREGFSALVEKTDRELILVGENGFSIQVIDQLEPLNK